MYVQFLREYFFGVIHAIILIVAQLPSKYGNVTLGQIAHFLVELCGKDALLFMSILTDSEINDAYKEKGSYLKFRYTDDNSIFGKIRKFFKKLEVEFDIPLKKGIIKKALMESIMKKWN